MKLLIPVLFLSLNAFCQTITVTGIPKTATNHSTVVVEVEIGQSSCYFDNSYKYSSYFTMTCRSPYAYWTEQFTLDSTQVHGNTPNLATPVFGYWLDPSTVGYIRYTLQGPGLTYGPSVTFFLLKNSDYAHAIYRTVAL